MQFKLFYEVIRDIVILDINREILMEKDNEGIMIEKLMRILLDLIFQERLKSIELNSTKA